MEPAANQRLLDIDPAALMQEGSQREKWEAISDLDGFFQRVYAYYRERGLWCILAARIISLLTLAFIIVGHTCHVARATLFFSPPSAALSCSCMCLCLCASARYMQCLFIFLVEMLNWSEIFDAHRTGQTCSQIPLIRPDWFQEMPFFRVFYYYLLFTLFWLWTLFHFVADLRPLFEMRTLFRDKLNLEDYQLQVVSWDEIVVKLIDLQKTSARRPRASLDRAPDHARPSDIS